MDRERIEKRFWPKVKKTSGCWIWQAGQYKEKWGSPYGAFTLSRAKDREALGEPAAAMAHRVSWVLANDVIPDGLSVLHRCDVRLCVRPDHLFLGTNQDNMDDMVAKGRASTTGGCFRLTPEQVLDIRARWPEERLDDLAEEFGVARSTVYAAATGVNWKKL